MRLRELVDRVIADGVITPEEHRELTRAVTEDPEISSEEREEIARLADMIARGEVRVVRASPDAPS
jgi:polyhydroxyalkanoate synthesis regulator phasin